MEITDLFLLTENETDPFMDESMEHCQVKMGHKIFVAC